MYERLGVGGMATVHRAKEHGIEGFERIVALKRLLPHLAEDASFVRSFVREAKLASMLQHANIVQLYELGRVGHVLFISMEYIQGRDVRKLLRQARRVAGPPPVPVFLALLSQLCDALDYAHGRTDENGEPLGLVHRDVSPSNLLVTRTGHLKVIDFGIARAQSAHLRTQTGRVKGKLAYMAPEALRAHDLDARSDIFSAGVIAHELLTARPLFACKNEYQTILRVQRAEVDPPSTHNPGCPPELDWMVLKALARDPAERWSSAAEFREALESFRARLGVSATHREVASWMEWAFATEAPPTGGFRGLAPASRSPSTSMETQPFGRGSTPHSSSYVSVEIETPSPAAVVALPGAPRPASQAPETDAAEEAADFAWGGEEAAAQAPPVHLDDIPDVSAKAVTPAGTRGRAGRKRTGIGEAASEGEEARFADTSSSMRFGSGIIETHRSRRRRNLLVGLLAFTLVSAGAGYGFMKWRNAPVAVPAEPLPGSAMLKFVIEPADALIDVQGYDRHQGSPFELEVQAPAVYQVEIRRDGYKTYISEIDVEDDRVYVVQMSLKPGGSDKASLVVRSSPSGQRVTIDGEPIAERTPINRELEPGEHVIAIHDDADKELWRYELVAAANTHYELHPSLQQERERDSRSEDRRSERRRSRYGSARRMDDDDHRQAVERSRALARRATASAPARKDETRIVPRATSMLDTFAMAEPPAVSVPQPPRRAAPARGSGPETIAPAKVRKRSGELPRLSAGQGAIPSRIDVKLCIDARGEVNSVNVLTDLPRRAGLELRRAFQTWRYTPYTEGGVARPACFAIAVRIAAGR